ncbi:SDR family NAD(P)-dependent oxidoreductase [Succinivibrio dextrinosolvens]|uniref:SDR family NAD(P)-dependent oxidoreductase n=1 Tax=Succinivibrio dextrinosolvens TaxID=83771 RepID=UPI002479F744|nr:SDR family NAD(P)-dependent oxidoreductase [Succinivibrio dextrinosolvens]
MNQYKTVFVTGASAGFGAAIAKLLAQNGYKVIAGARRRSKLEELTASNSNIYPIELDVTDEKSVSTLLNDLPDDLKNIDVLINNAGLALGTDPAYNCNLNEWKTMVDTNINGILNMTNAILPSMVKRNHGYIINLGSTAGCWPYRGGNVYGATKAFVEQFTRNLRTDLSGTAVKATVIKPGLCGNTEFSNIRFHGDDKKTAAVYQDTVSISPEDIANTVLWLLSTPPHMNVNDMEIMPVCQTYGGLSVVRNLDLNQKN